jgi:hypothetical protein
MQPSLIAQQSVTDPNGRAWTIGIRWLPRKPVWLGWGLRRKKRGDREWGWLDGLDPLGGLDFGDGPAVLLAIVAIAAAVFLLWFFVLPVAILALDLLFLLLLAALSVAARVLFRRPWIVEATTAGEQHQRPVVGSRASREMVENTARSIQLSGTLP